MMSAAGGDIDFATRFRSAARNALRRRIPADILTTELSILYYAFNWRRQPPTIPSAYTMHRQVGYSSIVVGLIVVLLVETVPVHLLVSRWSSLAAWTLTVLSLYACVWLVGDYRAMVARPIRVTPTHVSLRVGLRWEAEIPLASIEGAGRLAHNHEAPESGTLDAGLLDQPNLRLTLADTIEVIGLYGIRKSAREIWLTVDDAEGLCKELAQIPRDRDEPMQAPNA